MGSAERGELLTANMASSRLWNFPSMKLSSVLELVRKHFSVHDIIILTNEVDGLNDASADSAPVSEF